MIRLNCDGQDSWESLGLQGDPTSPFWLVQLIYKEISPGCSLEGMMLKLKLQYFGHLMRRTDSLEKTPRLGKIEGRRRRGQQRMRGFDIITDLMDMDLSKLLELMMDRKAWHAAFHGVEKSWSWLSDWTEWNVRYPVSCNWWPFFVVLILFLYVVLGVTKLPSEVSIKSRNILNTKTKISLWCLE